MSPISVVSVNGKNKDEGVNTMKVVIVGGVAGGATAAARLRRLDETMEIIILERSGYISYANCGLPYYIGGSIKDKAALTLQTPQSFYDRFRIDVRIKQEVIAIDSKNKVVRIKNLENDIVYQETYDKLILSPGAKAIMPPIEGIENKKIFTLRTVEDTFKIHTFIEKENVRKAVIVGAGFIGLEMAENLKEKGIEVTIVQLTDQVMSPLDKDMAAVVQNYIRDCGINLMLETSLTKVIEKNNKTYAVLDNKKELECDILLMAVGVQPENTLAKQAGLSLGIRGAIQVDEDMQTSNEDIYAVGDAVEVNHFITNDKTVISLAGPANKQGRIVANHICGINSKYKGSQGSSILKIFDLHVASTGLNEREAKGAGIDYDYVIISSSDHATYYPNAKSMYIKVLFEKTTGRILGGQIVGYGGVDKRIDVLATTIRAKMTAFDLTELELAYAPPFSSAKDPINMIGYVIENILLNKVEQVHWENVINHPDEVMVLDTRTNREYENGHLDGVLNIPLDELREHLQDIPKDKELYVYCHSGLRSYLACRILLQHGFKCKNVAGGYGFYEHIMKNKVLNSKGTGPCGL